MTKSQGLCETTLTERFEFEECVCGTYHGNLGPCLTYLPGANKRCAYCDHKLQCHTAIEARFYILYREVCGACGFPRYGDTCLKGAGLDGCLIFKMKVRQRAYQKVKPSLEWNNTKT